MNDGKFSVEVPFSTLRSWSPPFGHRCTNVPETAEVELSAGDKVVGEKLLKFVESFETQDSLTYRLKHELILEVGGKKE